MAFADHAGFTDAPRRSVLNSLRNQVHKLDPRFRRGEGYTASNRITFKFPDAKKIFLEIKVQRSAILLRVLDVPFAYPARITSEIPEDFRWGKKREIRLLNAD